MSWQENLIAETDMILPVFAVIRYTPLSIKTNFMGKRDDMNTILSKKGENLCRNEVEKGRCRNSCTDLSVSYEIVPRLLTLPQLRM